MTIPLARLNKWVTLSRSPSTSGDSDGFFAALSPAGVWAAIQPLTPSPDGRVISHLVTMRSHDQVGLDTRVLYGTRELFVKGFQNVDEDGVEMRLLCEEIVNQ
jgi:head-tail adaptor